MKRIRTAVIAAGCLVLCCSDGSARQRMSFAPGDRSRLSIASPAKARPAQHRLVRSPVRTARRGNRAFDEAAPSAPAGSGFTMQDGVLTYPAPARFQPKNLKR